jgi:hypothetical protein
MRRHVKALVLLAALLCAATAHARQEAAERLSSLLEGRVSFALPAAWVVERHHNTKTNGRAQIRIPYPAADSTPHRASATLIANTVPEGITVRHLSDGVYKNSFEGLRVLSDEFDGDEWRTMVWTARSGGVAYVMLNRFGLVGRTSVEVLAAFPLLEGGDPKWVEQTVADFNAFSASLKIDGRNRAGAAVKLDKIPQPQKVNPKP